MEALLKKLDIFFHKAEDEAAVDDAAREMDVPASELALLKALFAAYYGDSTSLAQFKQEQIIWLAPEQNSLYQAVRSGLKSAYNDAETVLSLEDYLAGKSVIDLELNKDAAAKDPERYRIMRDMLDYAFGYHERDDINAYLAEAKQHRWTHVGQVLAAIPLTLSRFSGAEELVDRFERQSTQREVFISTPDGGMHVPRIRREPYSTTHRQRASGAINYGLYGLMSCAESRARLRNQGAQPNSASENPQHSTDDLAAMQARFEMQMQ